MYHPRRILPQLDEQNANRHTLSAALFRPEVCYDEDGSKSKAAKASELGKGSRP